MIKSLNEEVKWYETEREKQNEDQTSVKIENLEKMVASQKDQIGEQFKVGDNTYFGESSHKIHPKIWNS